MDADADADAPDYGLLQAGLFDRHAQPAIGATIGGQVLRSNGPPVSDATVATTSVSIAGLFAPQDATDATGTYMLAGPMC